MSKENAFKSLISAAQASPSHSAVANQKRAKTAARRTRPDYTQVAVYVPTELHRDVKIKLLQQVPSRNFSELVEDLLAAYMDNRVVE